MLDLNRLRVLRSVVATGSVNEAALRLGYTPSTVSQHLKTLAREVGFPVIEHVGRGILPTPSAIQLAEASGEALDAMTRLDATARDLRQGETRKLAIATFASVAYTWMPAVTRALRREFPGLTLELSINEIQEDANAGQRDIEVHTEPMEETRHVPPAYSRVDLGIDDFVMALPREHPVAGARTADLRDFADDDWVEYDFRDQIATRISTRACAQAGFTPRYVTKAQDHVTGLAFVAAGVGVAVIPQLASRWSGFDVAYVRPLNPTPQRRIVALVRDRARTNPAAVRTMELLAIQGRKLGDESAR